MGCILIEDSTKGYNFTKSSQYNFTIAKINGSESNFSQVLSEIQNGSIYGVDNLQNKEILVFTNYSNPLCHSPSEDHVNIVQLSWEEEYAKLLFRAPLWRLNTHCKGIIVSGYLNDTYVMTHAVRHWGWFLPTKLLGIIPVPGIYSNRYALPILSVNRTIGKYLIDNKDTVNVTGFLNQSYQKQTSESPGVISNNVVGYRNITRSPGDAIVVLSNRIDGLWSETPGDSGNGGAILLGIAKFFNDNNIRPKYNLTFLFTTGEEYGMRGALHYVDSHPKGEYNFIRFIGLDQLGFTNGEIGGMVNLSINVQSDTIAKIVNAIQNDTKYEQRTGYGYKYAEIPESYGSEDYVWKDICDAILFEKGDGTWHGHHQTGENYQKGDSLTNIDRNDVDVSFELIWNITKYFTVNPDCQFHNVAYIATNTSGGTVPDSIKATFTVKSILPSDLIQVNASLYNATTDQPVPNKYQEMKVIADKEGVESNITLTMPQGVKEGDYYIKLQVYNSTARINKTLGYTYSVNDTETSPTFHLNRYHTIGDIRIGSSNANTHNTIRGSKFTVAEDALVHNITAYVYGISQYPPAEPTYQCMIYQTSDGHIIGYSNQVPCYETGWLTFTFTPKPVLIHNTQYMLCIWGNNENAVVYSTPQSQANGYVNGSYTFGTPPLIIAWDPMLGLQQYSLFCRYTLDIYLPQINDVTANPHTVGFGYNVTITANVTDNHSGVKNVSVKISYPGVGGMSNYTYPMDHVSGNMYRYIFVDTWQVGQYNYSIWAQDNENNSNTSDGYHFHVSAEATISIATLKDSYSGSQYINITDPPNPPENLTLVGRGLTWNTYYNASSGNNILETYIGPVNYQQDNGTWTPINYTISQLTSNHPAYIYGCRNGNDHGLFGVYFKSNAQSDWPVAFTYNRSDDPTIHAIRTKLVGVGYVDPSSNWAYQYLQNAQSSQGQTNGNSITYEDVFTGTDVTWSYGNTELKEEITLSNATKTVLQNHPPSQYGLNDASSYLVFITKLDHQNLDMYNASGMLTENVTISDTGVNFKDALGQFKCALPLGEAYELNNESMRQKLIYRIVHLNGDTYLLSGLKISDLNAMTFPVVIDPTLTVYSISSDGYISNSGTNYNTVRTASTGTVNSSGTYITIGQNKVANFPATYYIYRGFVFFNTSALPSNAYLDNATLSIYKKDDYSSTDFDITIQNGQPTYPHNPMQSSDYNRNDYSGDGGRLNTSRLANGYNAITLTNLNWINKTGTTKLCLRSNRDISGTTPTGNEYVNVYSNEFLGSCPPKLVIAYRNQSKIKNTGSTNIKGYLLIQVQFYETSKGVAPRWVVDNDTVNETSPRTINSDSQLALDTIFNGKIRASNLQHGTGTYRVYTAFRDPDGNILKTNTGVELKAWWQFSKT